MLLSLLLELNHILSVIWSVWLHYLRSNSASSIIIWSRNLRLLWNVSSLCCWYICLWLFSLFDWSCLLILSFSCSWRWCGWRIRSLLFWLIVFSLGIRVVSYMIYYIVDWLNECITWLSWWGCCLFILLALHCNF